MIGISVFYDGRQVPRENFRTFIYDSENKKKLVNSWDEYLEEIQSGIWFSSERNLVSEESDEKTEIPHKQKRKKRGS